MENTNPDRGFLIQAPCGSGKSYWLSLLTPDHAKNWIDGDALLDERGVKNRNYFWYETGRQKERDLITKTFERELDRGVNILYSGNPLVMTIPTQLIIHPLPEIRWERLRSRAGYIPSRAQFDREENAYKEASRNLPTFYGDIPDVQTLKALVERK